MTTATSPMQIFADNLNAHLATGGTVMVSAYGRGTQYGTKHAGWFTCTSKGNLLVKHGTGHNCLSFGARLLVSVKAYAA